MLKLLAEQVVRSLEASVRIPGRAKKALAMELVRGLLAELGADEASDLVIDAEIESAVATLPRSNEWTCQRCHRTKAPTESLKGWGVAYRDGVVCPGCWGAAGSQE